MADSEPAMLCAFSDGRNEEAAQFATVTTDGQLNVWDTMTNDVLAMKKANLTDPTTSIIWERWHQVDAGRKKKRQKKSAQPSTSTARILIGTLQGNVMVFSHQSNATIQMKEKHSGRVNGLTWGKDADSVFSCSNDHYIYKWSLSEGNPTQKFRSDDDEPITAVSYCACLQPAGVEALFYAASRITILDITNNTKLKQIVGHANPVNTLKLTPTNQLVSVSHTQSDDTLIYAWSTDAAVTGTKPDVTFDGGESIVCVDVTPLMENKIHTNT
jgi:WD40 repeat protein